MDEMFHQTNPHSHNIEDENEQEPQLHHHHHHINSDHHNLLFDYGHIPINPMDNLGPRSSKSQRRLLATTENTSNNNISSVDDDKKKHRDIERQRRQEMATLYSSLRTLLPLDYIKGKRAISDHMNGAVRYIKDLQKRIELLSAKRDELKKECSSSSCSGFDPGMSSNDSANLPTSAVVRQSLDGVEVVISTGFGDQALTLSRVLQLMLEGGLDVVSCISTRVNGGMIHTINSEVSNLTSVDVAKLEEKLNEAISSLSRNS